MNKLSTSAARKIIDDFAREIRDRKTKGPKPTKDVINFRNERKDGVERDVYLVPLELLRYRKDNGRISSDVLNYEKNHGPLLEDSEEAQEIIGKFLEEKDKEKTDELRRSIEHETQREPAIITCDGFLINGNRRKMVLKSLLKKYPGDERFTTMKVIILPGKGDEGGPPTLLEIEQIENRYQLQSDGKADYYGFDKALSMRRKIDLGMRLREQLRDDPAYAGLPEKQFNEILKKTESEYLKPLECVDRYLIHLRRDGLYSTISAGLGDPEGRWQAFLDYSKFYEQMLDEKRRTQLGITDSEVGKIEDAAFKIIRKRELPDLPKVHKIMRDFQKLIKIKESRKALFKLNEIDLTLPKEDRYDKDGKEYDERHIDKAWGGRYAPVIINQVKTAVQLCERSREIEAPIALLKAALEKLNQVDRDLMNIGKDDIECAMKLSREIQDRAKELESEFYHNLKELKKLTQKSKSK